jgi:hypothetical protein
MNLEGATMRTVLAVTIALALCAPVAARAAQTDPNADLNQMVSTYHQVRVVRVIERFPNGTAATVDMIPYSQYRIAAAPGQDPALIMQLAAHPVPDLTSTGSTYTTKSLGVKSIDGVKVNGYSIANADGSYKEDVWVNESHLPMYADVTTQGQSISLQFGDYDNTTLIGVR